MIRDRTLVERVKRSLADPRDVCRRLGLDKGAKSQRAGLLIRCPAHDDTNPSCSVRIAGDGTIAVKCHSCGYSGDVLHLVAAAFGLDHRTHFAKLLERAQELGRISPPPRIEPRATIHSDVAPLADARFAAVVGTLLYWGRLGDGTASDVDDYLNRRGILEAARSEGWAALAAPDRQAHWSRELWAIAKSGAGTAPPYTESDLRRTGLFAGRAFAHPAARLCIPWRDPGGRLINLQRRRIDDGEPRYVGAKGRSFVWPYGVEAVARAPGAAIAIVEGAIDVLALRMVLAERGESAVVLGVPGLGAWRSSWGALARGRVVAVAVDADNAGEQHVMQIARDCMVAGALRAERWTPPRKDWAASVGERT